MTLQSEAEALYGMLPEGFTSARNDRAKEVRAAGDRALAARIRKLRKPRVAAWVLNTLVRRLPDEIEGLVELGAQIRAAQADADRDELRTLGDQRRALTGELTQRARSIATDLGHRVDDHLALEIENTLRAAMADPSGGAALRSGLLVDSFGVTGFEPVDVARVVAVPEAVETPAAQPQRHLRAVPEPTREPKPKPKPKPRKVADPGKRASAKAEEARQQAREQLDTAHEARERAVESLTKAVAERERLEQERSELQERLRTLDRELARAHRGESRASRERERTDQEYAAAQRRMQQVER